MQDEVNEKIIALCIQTTRMSTGVLKASMRKFLDGMSRQKQKRVQVKQAVKNRKSTGKGQRKRRKRQEMKKPHGKQTIKQLIAQGAQLTNIQITDQNIKSFDRVARKYGIDYSLKKDSHVKPPLYLVFFKSKDVDVMTAAFKEYAGIELDQSKKKKPSVRKKLQKTQERKAKTSSESQDEAESQRAGTMIREKMQNIQMKRVVILSIPYLIIFYLADKCFWLYRHCIGDSMIEKIGVMLMNFQLAFTNWLPSFHMQDLLGGLVTALIFRLILYYKVKNAKKFRHGEEYGSARWGNRKDIEPFEDPVFENNIILTETERLTMNSRPKAPKYARNKNVIVIGGSGSGKTRFYVKPNLMQMTDRVSYVVTDPKGTIIVECGKMLVNGGYRIKVLNTINFKKSMHYNPFHYIRSEKDILKLVNTIIANTKGEGEKSTEDFWVSATRSQAVKSLRTVLVY